jgi:lysyl-tRNA synthetase class 1
LKPPPRRRIVLGLDKLPSYISEYDKAERIYHNIEPFEEPSELHTIQRSYEIAHFNKVPKYIGFQLDINHAIILGQLVEEGKAGTQKAIDKLLATGILAKKPTAAVKAHIQSRLTLARNWINDCAPAHLRINIPDEISEDIMNNIDPDMQKIVKALAKTLKAISWKQEEIKTAMMDLKTEFNLSRKKMTAFFGVLYQIFLGTSRGPRFAPFIASLEQDWVINRLKQVKKK